MKKLTIIKMVPNIGENMRTTPPMNPTTVITRPQRPKLLPDKIIVIICQIPTTAKMNRRIPNNDEYWGAS